MINILLLTNVDNVDEEPAYFHSFEMVHKIGSICLRANDPPIVFNILDTQKKRFGSRLKKAAKNLMYEFKEVSIKDKINLDIVISILEKDKEDRVTDQIKRLVDKLTEIGVEATTALVPVQETYKERKENPIKSVRKWKIESPENHDPYGGDMDVVDRFYNDGKVKKLGDIGLRFLFDYTDTDHIDPWAMVNPWPQI